MEASLAKRCDGIIAVSLCEYEHALGLGIPASKLCLIPNGVAPDPPVMTAQARRILRQDWGIQDGEVCIGFVGRLVPVKSPDIMLKSFAALRESGALHARLVIVGEGPLATDLRRLTAALRLEACVTWLGERDARTLMDAFDIFALTSDSEAAGLVVLEAMARGLPIVATSVGLVPQAMQPGVNGFVTPVRDVLKIASSLLTLVNNAELRARMGRASQAISINFSVDRMVDQTLELYERLVSGTWSSNVSPDLGVPALH